MGRSEGGAGSIASTVWFLVFELEDAYGFRVSGEIMGIEMRWKCRGPTPQSMTRLGSNVITIENLVYTSTVDIGNEMGNAEEEYTYIYIYTRKR